VSDPATTTDLHALRLGGFVAADRIAAGTGLGTDTVRAALERAAASGHAVERTRRISGWTLTPAGRTEHAALLAAELERVGARAAVEQADAAFLALNQPFKALCSRWQMRPDGSPNDHADAAYDGAVVADLGPLHERVVAITTGLAGALPRFDRYPRAFTSALDRLRGGDRRAFAAPLSASYHDVWMELHQDLLSTLGRERSATDGH
jgi:hypothetical protein